MPIITKKNNTFKIAIITGASSGIGYGLGKYLASKNYIVYSLSRVAKEDSNIRFLECDITNYQQVEDCLDEIFNKHKRIDLIVNNSGFGVTSSIEELNIDNYDQMIKVNVLAALNICLQSIKYLKQSNGKIINMGSIVSEIVLPFGTPYSISKQLLKLVSFHLHVECKKQNVSICNLIVGKTNSNFDKNRIINNPSNSDYQQVLDIFTNNLFKSVKYGMKIDQVAKYIYKLAQRKKIPQQKIIGIRNKLMIFFYKIIPVKWANKINYDFFCKNEK